MTTGGLPEPDCTAGCEDGTVRRRLPGSQATVEEPCPHCDGTGKEPPLSERELEARGQQVLL